MRFVVVDACVAIKWFSLEPDSDAALRLLRDEDTLFIAPDFFRLEVINGVLRQLREKGAHEGLVDRSLAEIHATMPHLVPAHLLVDRATRLARSMSHPIYDCLYLALAERWDTVLVTADLAFVKRCNEKLPDDPIVRRLRTLDNYDAA